MIKYWFKLETWSSINFYRSTTIWLIDLLWQLAFYSQLHASETYSRDNDNVCAKEKVYLHANVQLCWSDSLAHMLEHTPTLWFTCNSTQPSQHTHTTTESYHAGGVRGETQARKNSDLIHNYYIFYIFIYSFIQF